MFDTTVPTFLSIYILTSITTLNGQLIVNLPDGQIEGHSLKSSNGNPYYVFQEIPYAAPPIGTERFTEPRKPEPWSGILNVTQNTKQCIQFSTTPVSSLTETEDCLYLNVYTPQKPGNTTLLPVYFYVHGGAFVLGNGAYDGLNPNRFMDYGIVVVTINYRLGPLGLLATGDDVIPGNLGLKDQVFALRWVNANIRLFGGDPEKVTIGGESAGAYSVGSLILGENISGLFRGAIQNSGSSIGQLSYSARAKENAFNLAKALDPKLNSDKSQDILSVLRLASIKDMVAVDVRVSPADVPSGGYVLGLNWLPVIENKNARNALISHPMHESFMNGDFNQVPMLLGFNSEEGLGCIDWSPTSSAGVYDRNSSLLVDSRRNVPLENVSFVGEQLKKMYTDSTFVEDQAAYVKYSSDAGFTTSMLRQAECSSKYVPVYFYQFSYMGSVSSNNHHRVPGAPGVGHGEDLFYVWDKGELSTDLDLLTSKRLLSLFTNFIKYLNPTPTSDDLFNNIKWTTVQNSDLQYLNINDTLEMQNSPRQYSRIKSLLLEYIKPPYNVF